MAEAVPGDGRETNGDVGNRRVPYAAVGVLALAQVAGLMLASSLSALAVPWQQRLGLTASQTTMLAVIAGLAMTATMLVGGTLSDRLGRRNAGRAGLAAMFLGCVVLALSSTPVLLGAGIATAATGGGVVSVAVSAGVVDIAPGRDRARAYAVLGALVTAGTAAWPIAVGTLVTTAYWRVTLWACAPVTLVAAVALARVPNERRETKWAKDPLGFIGTLAVGTSLAVSFQALTNGLSPFGVSMAVVALATIAAFVAWELRHATPLLDLRALKNGRFTLAVLTLAAIAMTGTVLGVLAVQYAMFVLDLGPALAGVTVLPAAATVTLGTLLGPVVARRVGGRWLVGGAFFAAGGVCLLHILVESPGQAAWPFVVLAVAQFCAALAWAPTNAALAASVPSANAGVAFGVSGTVRRLLVVVTVALTAGIFNATYRAAVHPAVRAADPRTGARDAEASLGAAIAARRRLAQVLGPQRASEFVRVEKSAFRKAQRRDLTLVVVVFAVAGLAAILFMPARPATDAGAPPAGH